MENNQTQQVQTQTAVAPEVAAPEQTTEKLFTQEEMNKIIEKRLARDRKDLEARIKAEVSEAEKLAKMSEAEKQKALFEKQVREFEETKKAFERERTLNEISKQLADANLPIEFSEYLLTDNTETAYENIAVFKDKWNAALEKALDERMKGKTPISAPQKSRGTLTMEEIKTMSTAEIQARYSEVMQVLKNQ